MFRIATARRTQIALGRACARPTTPRFLLRSTQFRTYLSGSDSDLSDAPPTAKTVASDRQTTKRERTPEEVAKKAALERQDDLQRDWDTTILSYEEFLPRTQNPSPDSYIIDVREKEEVMQGMIPGAVNLPLSVLSSALHLPRHSFFEKFGFEKPKVDQEVVFYCRSGVRSATAADVAKRNGYDTNKIYSYKGSWSEWTAKQTQKPIFG